MKCRNCNRDFADKLNYCPYCGTSSRAVSTDGADAEQTYGRRPSVEPAGEAPTGSVRRVKLNLPQELLEPEASPPVPTASKSLAVPTASTAPTAPIVPETRNFSVGRVGLPVESAEDGPTPTTPSRPAAKPVAQPPNSRETEARVTPVKPISAPPSQVPDLAKETVITPNHVDAGEVEQPSVKEETKLFSQEEMRRVSEAEQDRVAPGATDREADVSSVETAVESETEPAADAEERESAGQAIARLLGRAKAAILIFLAAAAIFFRKLGAKIASGSKTAVKGTASFARHAASKTATGASVIKTKAGDSVQLFRDKRAKHKETKARLAEQAREQKERENLRLLQEEAERTRHELPRADSYSSDFIPAGEYFEQSDSDLDGVPHFDDYSEVGAAEEEAPYFEENYQAVAEAPLASDNRYTSFVEEADDREAPEAYDYRGPRRVSHAASAEAYRARYAEDEATEAGDGALPQGRSRVRRKPSAVRDAYEWLMIRVRPIHIVLVLLAVISVFSWFFIKNLGSPTKDFAQALESRNYEQAAKLYTEDYKGKEELEESSAADLAAYLSTLKQNAIGGRTTYSATDAALSVIRNSKLYTGDYKVLVDKTAEELSVLQQADAIYQAGKEKLNDLDYPGAIGDFNRVIDLYPSYRDTADLLARARDRYRESVVRRVGTLQSQSNYKEAEGMIVEALTLIPEDPVLLNLKKNNDAKSISSLFETTASGAERYFQSGDFVSVFKVIDEALLTDPNDDSIKQLRVEYEIKCAESILNAADNIFLQGNRDSALEKVDEGLLLLPENELLTAAKTRYQNTEPGEQDPETTNNDPTPSPTPPAGESVTDSLHRETYKDAAGQSHADSVEQVYTYTGNSSVVEQVIFQNAGGGTRFVGELALGPVEQYTQVYYQIYSSSNQARPLRYGSLIARAGDDPGKGYKIAVDLPANNAKSFIVNLNYLQGGEIRTVLDLRFIR